eukprot:scaffold10222_cov135-Isochrysis_galbana.AAC.10
MPRRRSPHVVDRRSAATEDPLRVLEMNSSTSSAVGPSIPSIMKVPLLAVRILRSFGGALWARAAAGANGSGSLCLAIVAGAVESPSRDGVSITGSTFAEEARDRANRLLRDRFLKDGSSPGSRTSEGRVPQNSIVTLPAWHTIGASDGQLTGPLALSAWRTAVRLPTADPMTTACK